MSDETLLGDAPVEAGDLVVLPELFDTGFSFNLDTTTDDGTTVGFLRGLATEHGVTVQGGYTVRATNGRGLNRAIGGGPDGTTLTEYDKLHPFSFGKEAEHFDAGDVMTTYAWGGLSVCPLICYDLRFPEAFRAGVDLGATAFALGANWPEARHVHWRTLVRARAIETLAFMFAVNRGGSDPALRYRGGSAAIDPKGEVLAEADDSETVLSVDIDAKAPDAWRAAFPALADRHPILNPDRSASENIIDR